MMHQGGAGGQGSETRQPSSPRGGSSAGNNNSVPNFSLLGQQMSNYGSAQQQQQQQQQHHLNQNHQHPPNANVNFSLGVQAPLQPFNKGHQSPQAPNNGNNVGGDAAGFANIQNVNPMVAAGQNFNQGHQFMNQQMMQQSNGGVTADFMKINQQQAAQSAQAGQAPLAMPTAAPNVSTEAIMNALNTIQQKIMQLQAIIPYMAQNQPSSVAVQQQAAAAISQLAQVAANMFPSNQGQQQQQQQQSQQPQQQQQPQAQQNMPLTQVPMPDPHQLFGSPVTPGYNFFQQSGSAAANNTSGGNNGLAGVNFSTLQGGGSGVTVEMGTTATSLANQIAAIDGGVSGSSTTGAGQAMGVASKSTPPGGVQSFAQGQVAASHVPSVATNNINSSMAARSKQGSPRRSNQIGANGMNRGGNNGIAGDMAHASNTRSVNSGGMTASPVDDHDVGGARDDDDDGDGENLVPGSYDLVEMEAIEILAEHTHFCEICGKGFKRDANLRMHMRGHGDEYKTPAALARPDKASHEMNIVRQRRFSCPYVGCKRNKKHRKFQPLKTMLCVKNHYRRSHCPKILTCNKCKTKKFSVVADLKTHEKHCGCDKWQCSCGTTFSRKDKLFGHIGLFAGHTPAMPFNEVDGSGGLDVSEIPGNPSSMSSPGNDASGYGLSGGANMNSGNSSSIGLNGGSGMGLGGNGLQGLTSRGSNPGGSALNISKDGNALTQENSSSSDSFPSIPGSAMPMNFPSLFNTKFFQTTSGGNSSPDGLH